MSEDSAAKHRAKQTVINLLLSLVASLGVMLAIILIVPRDDSNRIKPVDHIALAEGASAAAGRPVLGLPLPEGWWANHATWVATAADGVDYWEVGFVGPKNQYIGLTQAFEVNPTWVALRSAGFIPDSSTTGSANWLKLTPGPNVDADPVLWTLETDGDFVSLEGNATAAEFSEFANLVETELNE
ncbi:DUF4245 family protein [Rhodoluna limnophila]|uniref:DUF4245 family protein n=1 Tax=Rhodoluna limnophila TaxID=232537 RepID=UPI001561BE0D|nr:DUF4245 family protein [Rhodoluna limnophila]